MPFSVALPRWNMDRIYHGFADPRFSEDCRKVSYMLDQAASLCSGPGSQGIANWVRQFLDACSWLYQAEETLFSYTSCLRDADSSDDVALRWLDRLESLFVPFAGIEVRFRYSLAAIPNSDFLKLFTSTIELEPYRSTLVLMREAASHQMEAELEELAADLARSGSSAWTRLHAELLANAHATWIDGSQQTVTMLRSLAHHPERSVRKAAFLAECAALKPHRKAFAAALNGAKGVCLSIGARRNWADPLDEARFQSRMSEKTFASMLATMEASLPLMQRYLKAKARALGLAQLSWYDLYAPLPKQSFFPPKNQSAKPLTQIQGHELSAWEDAIDIVCKSFGAFDPNFEAFARKAVAEAWIDAQPRSGKRGGAYCTDLPLYGESRILCSYAGTVDDMITVAHELGHAWHNKQLSEMPRVLAMVPMPLAETASITAEQLVFDYLAGQKNSQPALAFEMDEHFLADATEVIVDILARFRFEQQVFAKRRDGELSPDELENLMVAAEASAYGDAVDPTSLHPLAWAVKGHYYASGLSYYNFPYAFGLLFGLGLRSGHKRDPDGAAKRFCEVLRLAGSLPVEALGKVAGIDVEDKAFWNDALSLIEKRVENFENQVGRNP